MSILRRAAPRPAFRPPFSAASAEPARRSAAILLLATMAAACSSSPAPSTSAPPPSDVAASAPSGTPAPTPEPTATPAPTPRFANEPDEELAGMIPTEANGVPIVVAPFDEFALTPGDIGAVYGEIGYRFTSLVLAYVEEPRTTLYAVRVDGDPVATADLEPHLETAGRYVGIAGLERDPWTSTTVGGHPVWVRPEDNATAAGTMIYTWSSGEFVFLLIGVDDAVNRAIVAALPGEAAPTPEPSASAGPSGAGGSPSAAPSTSGG
jgi:hypothetical protein